MPAEKNGCSCADTMYDLQRPVTVDFWAFLTAAMRRTSYSRLLSSALPVRSGPRYPAMRLVGRLPHPNIVRKGL